MHIHMNTGVEATVFVNDPVDQGSIPGWVLQITQKIVFVSRSS